MRSQQVVRTNWARWLLRKEEKLLLREMSDYRMSSQRQGKGKIATTVFWRGWSSKCQSWGNQKKPSLCAPLALGMAPSLSESHWQDLHFLLSQLAIYNCHYHDRCRASSRDLYNGFQRFQHCWFWESANAKTCQKHADEIVVFSFISMH